MGNVVFADDPQKLIDQFIGTPINNDNNEKIGEIIAGEYSKENDCLYLTYILLIYHVMRPLVIRCMESYYIGFSKKCVKICIP